MTALWARKISAELQRRGINWTQPIARPGEGPLNRRVEFIIEEQDINETKVDILEGDASEKIIEEKKL